MLEFDHRPTPSVRRFRIGPSPSPWQRLGSVALSWLVAMGAAGCTDQGQAIEATGDGAAVATDADDERSKKDEELPPVEVVSLERGAIEAVLRFSTNLEAESAIEVFSQAARQVIELRVEEGDRVEKNQILVRLQDEEQRSELARIESQLAKARREFQRQQNLYAQQLISEQVMNEATYDVEQLELAFGDAKRNLSYTEVRAPIAGTITGRHVNLGDHITVNQHLFDLVDFDTIVARIYVPEKELERLRLAQVARLFSDSIAGDARNGEVIRIAPIVDPRSGTVKVTVGIPRNQGLLPGMYVEVELVTDTREDALLVPKRAVIYDQNEAFLYRLTDEMTAQRLRIAILLEDRENILPSTGSGASGLSPEGLGPRSLAVGDRIVVAGQAGLKDGAEVRLAGRKTTDAAEGAAVDEADAAGAGAGS